MLQKKIIHRKCILWHIFETCYSNLSMIITIDVILPWNNVTGLHSWGFINHFTRMKMICGFFICQKNIAIYVCHACSDWAGLGGGKIGMNQLVFINNCFPSDFRPSPDPPSSCSAALKSCGGRKQSFRQFFDVRKDNKDPSWSPGLRITAFLLLISKPKWFEYATKN